MTAQHLIRTWAALALLTTLGTALHFSTAAPKVMGALILIAAGLKARLVLLDYLELRGTAGWAGGTIGSLAALIALLLVLLLAA
ncbi:MAG: cytochrome C oxidase subunit IV family protein [Sulfitobacter sp.]